MAVKAKPSSVNKVSFGNKWEGRHTKRRNKHERKTKPYKGQGR